MSSNNEGLMAQSLCVAVPGRALVSDLQLVAKRGEFVIVLGKNGAGKTLTLHTLAGLREAAGGECVLEGVALARWKRKALAKKLALLPQNSEDIFPASVFDTVLIGRHPHIGTLRLESGQDRDIAHDALDAVGLSGCAARDVASLSGGERRRLALAQILAQAPDYFLLDEPLNHLDPQHQLETLALLRKRADEGACVIASVHDVNLAVRHADAALLLFGDGRWTYGPVNEVVTAGHLSELFDVGVEAVDWRGTTLFATAPGERSDG